MSARVTADKTAPKGPAQQRLRAALRKSVRIPRSVLACTVFGLALLAGYAVLYAVLLVAEPALADGMLRMFLFTLAAGREAAMLDALQGHDPVPTWFVLAMSVLDDLGSLALSIAAVWFIHRKLRGHPVTGGWFLDVEKQALRHRRFIRRWGLPGLTAFFFLPGLGSGNVAVAVIGVLARVHIARLFLLLGIAAVAIDTFWLLSIRGALGLVPEQPAWLAWVPFAVVGIVVVSSIVDLGRTWHERHVLLLARVTPPTGARLAQMKSWGFRTRGDLLEVDTRVLAEHTGPGHRVRLRSIASLLRIPSMEPQHAARLYDVGVRGLSDLGKAAPALVREALSEQGLEVDAATASQWRVQAAAAASVEEAAWHA